MNSSNLIYLVSTTSSVPENSSRTIEDEFELAESKYSEYQTADHLWVNGGILIIIMGTIGHLLSILVLLGSKRMRLLSLTVFLVANSIAGLAALYVGLLRQMILHKTHWDVDVRDKTDDFGCRIHAGLTYMSLQFFSWLQASIAIERTIAVMRPLQYKRWCTWRRNLICVAVIVALLAALNSIVVVVYEKQSDGRCIESTSPEKKYLFAVVWGYTDLVLYSLFPVAVIVPCNVLTLKAIYQSQPGHQSRGRKYLQLTLMLVIQNCVCVATTLPISIIFLMPWPSDTLSPAAAKREIDWTIVSLLQYFGTTFSFLIYSTSARTFRRAVLDLFLKGFNANLASLSGLSSVHKRTKNGKSSTGPRPSA